MLSDTSRWFRSRTQNTLGEGRITERELSRFVVRPASNSYLGPVRMATQVAKGCLELLITTSRSVFVEHTWRFSILGSGLAMFFLQALFPSDPRSAL